MTTPSKASSAAYVLQRLRFRACLLAAGLALAVPLVGCDLFHSDFDIAVGNRRQTRCRSLRTVERSEKSVRI